MLDHGCHFCLLQHDLRYPNPVRIMIFTPRKLPRMLVVPGQQELPEFGEPVVNTRIIAGGFHEEFAFYRRSE